jgi:hypothetical protein
MTKIEFAKKHPVIFWSCTVFGALFVLGLIVGPQQPTNSRDWQREPLTMTECVAFLQQEFDGRGRQFWHDRWIDRYPTQRDFAAICRNQYGVR